MGVAASLFCRVNETVLAIMTASAVTHEAIVLWDVGYATRLRPPSATEQHIHSFLEVLPFTALAFQACLNPEDVAVLAGRGSRRPNWRLEPKPEPAALLGSAGATIAATLLLVVPHLEEFIRCYRVDHTLMPHKRPN